MRKVNRLAFLCGSALFRGRMFSVLAGLQSFAGAPEKSVQRNESVRGMEIRGKREREAKIGVKIRLKHVENR